MNIDDSNEWLVSLPLAAYGQIIRGDETTSEDQVAEACTPELAHRIVACVNAFSGVPTAKIEPLVEKLKEAARTMLALWFQYGDVSQSAPAGVLAFDHKFMSAGEDAAAFLASMGYVIERGPLVCVTKAGLALIDVGKDFLGIDEVPAS